jgi:transposase-like protein
MVTCPHCAKQFQVEATFIFQQTPYCPLCDKPFALTLYFQAGGKSEWICPTCGGCSCE